MSFMSNHFTIQVVVHVQWSSNGSYEAFLIKSGWVGGAGVLSRPLTDSFAVGRRQKYTTIEAIHRLSAPI
jgi:hypothetical protein